MSCPPYECFVDQYHVDSVGRSHCTGSLEMSTHVIIFSQAVHFQLYASDDNVIHGIDHIANLNSKFAVIIITAKSCILPILAIKATKLLGGIGDDSSKSYAGTQK